MEQKLKIIEETIAAMQEVYQSPLPGKDKCEKIAFLTSAMLTVITKDNNDAQNATTENKDM